jgi:hypothetical protein
MARWPDRAELTVEVDVLPYWADAYRAVEIRAASPAAPAVVRTASARTDAELRAAGNEPRYTYTDALRAVYDLGQRDANTLANRVLVAACTPLNDRIRDLEDQIARLRARAEP